MTNSTKEDLFEWNTQFYRLYTPSTVIQVIYLILGIFGNSLVLIVYRDRVRSKKGDRLFIVALATIDFIGCIFSTSLSFLYNIYAVMFPSSAVCKLLHFGACTCIVSSLLILFVIAIQRFQKLCKPTSKQMTLWLKKCLTLCVILLGCLSSVPALFLYENVSIDHPTLDVSGQICTSPPELQTYSDLYRGYLITGEVIVLIVICVLYTFVGRTLFKSLKFNFARTKTSPLTTESSHSTTPIGMKTSKTLKDNQIDVSTTVSTTDRSFDVDSKRFPQVSSPRSPYKGDQSGYTRKYTLIFTLITAVAVTCYIPPLIILFLETRDKGFWFDRSDGVTLALVIIRRLYIVNHIANPFIYGLCDRDFRSELKRMFRCFMCFSGPAQ